MKKFGLLCILLVALSGLVWAQTVGNLSSTATTKDSPASTVEQKKVEKAEAVTGENLLAPENFEAVSPAETPRDNGRSLDNCTVPFPEGFESAGALPACWVIVDVNADTKTWSVQTGGAHSGTYALRTYYSAAGVYPNDWAFSPMVNLIGGQLYELKLWEKTASSSYAEKMEIMYGAEQSVAGMTNVISATVTYTNTAYAEVSFSFTPDHDGPVSIGFHNNSDPDRYYFWMDDISLTAVVDHNFAVTGITAPLTTTRQNPEADVVVTAIVKNVGLTTEAGSVFYQFDGGEVMAEPTIELAQNATETHTFATPIHCPPVDGYYTLKVWAQVDGDPDPANDTATVAVWVMNCNRTLPVTEGFEGLVTPALPVCWAKENIDADTYMWGSSSSYYRTGTRSMSSGVKYSATATNDWLYTPGLNLEGGVAYQLKYWYRASTASPTNGPTYEVKWGTAQTSAAMTSGTLVASNRVTVATYAQLTVPFTPTETGVYFIGFHTTTSYYALVLDDIEISAVPLAAELAISALAPCGAQGPNGAAIVSFRLTNQGGGASAPVTANFSYDNGAKTGTAAVPSIAPASFFDVFFESTVDLSIGAHTLSGWFLPHDAPATNDSMGCALTVARLCPVMTPEDANLDPVPDVDWAGSVSGNCGNGGKWVGKFTAIQNFIYHFDLCPAAPGAGAGSSDLDIKIVTSDGTIIPGVDGSCTGGASTYLPNDWTWVATANGTFYVVVAPYNSYSSNTCIGTATNTLTLQYYGVSPINCATYEPCGAPAEVEPNDACTDIANFQTLAFGGIGDTLNYYGTVCPGTDVDYWYAPAVPLGSTLKIALFEGTDCNSVSAAVKMYGATAVDGSCTTPGTTAVSEFILTSCPEFTGGYIAVKKASGLENKYRLRAVWLPAEVCPNVTVPNQYSLGPCVGPIDDNTMVYYPIVVPIRYHITDLNVRINMTHTYVGDIDLYLVTPWLDTLMLTTGNGGSGENFTNTLFDDAATASITTIVLGDAPFSNSYQPEELLAAVNNHDAAGTWQFAVGDHANGDIGSTNCLSLEFQYDWILAVEMQDAFVATAGNGSVSLAWATASETENARFEVLRDNELVGTRDGQGTVSARTAYTFVDDGVSNGRTYNYTLVSVNVRGERNTVATASAMPSVSSGPVTEYALRQNYPNPFNPTTTIGFDLLESGNVTLKVYNLMGQEVMTVVNGTMAAGRHSVAFDAANLSSGLYLYRIEANGFSAEKKMLLMK